MLLNRYLNNIIKKYSLDIVHLHGGPGGLLYLQKPSVPLVYTSHHTYWQQSTYIPNQTWKKIFLPLEKKGFEVADRIIAVSKDTQSVLSEKYAIDPAKLKYIPNGITIQNDLITKRASSISNQILYIGRIDKRKGIEFLLKALILINKKNPEVLLHIVGEGKDKLRLEHFSATNNLNVKFYGYLSDSEINKLYQSSTIQIVPSIFEGFGITVLEGMAHRIPVIATDVDGLRTIIDNRENGLLVPYGDTKALAKAILDLIKDRTLQQKLVSNASAGLSQYNWNSIYAQTVNVYENSIQ